MSVILAFGYGENILLIISFLILILIFLFKKKVLFRFLAKLNKLILPSLYKKDMKKLKRVEMLIIAYRYWVTKNSL